MKSGAPISIDNVEYLIQRYQYFLVDQFGVLHNGFEAYRGAAEALRLIKRSGGKVVIISNSGKRASANKQRMRDLGFGDDCFDELVTSGEVAWHLLKDQFIGSRFTAGVNCFFLSNNDDRSAVEGLDLTEVNCVESAQLILLSGQHLDGEGLASLCKRLLPAAERRVPCICTNPDKIAYAKSGKVFSSGAVAEWYESQGGEVIWLGKPHAEIYEYILSGQGMLDQKNVVCVGDSVEHDIKGGAGQNLATVLVRTGINDHCTDVELERLYRQHSARPDYVIASFSVPG